MPPIGKCPTFSYHGSKCTIAKWTIENFPKNIHTYYEPFAGRGNILFRLLTTNGFNINNFVINDLYTGTWLQELKEYGGNWDFIPDIVNYDVYDHWKQQSDSLEKRMIEPIVCYHGNRWNIQGSAINDPNNTTQYFSKNYKENWTRKLQIAQKLLQDNNVKITQLNWELFLNEQSFRGCDFIYCDPPYFEKYDEKKTYPSINHERFLDRIKEIECGVSVANYYNPLYADKLSNWKLSSRTRVSMAKGRQTGHSNGKTEKQEYLWIK